MKPARTPEELRAALGPGAIIEGGAWTRADLSATSFDGADVTGSDFTGSDMERATFRGARVRDATLDGVRFGDAILDRSVFDRCSLRNARFARLTSAPEPTTAGAYFIDCDLTGTDWTDRDMSGATFLRCKLSGARGKPKATDGLVVQACDCDMDTFLAALAGEPPPNRTPRTDSELRLAAAKVPCEVCGAAPPEKLDVFRAGPKAILGGKCPYCAKGRAITFTVDVHPPPPVPVHEPPPIAREIIGERVVGRLIAPARPPGTVGELFDALEVPLELAAVATNGIGTIVQPDGRFERLPGPPRVVSSIVARYTFDAAREQPLTTLEALRARKLSSFAVVAIATEAISAALTERFGAPVEIVGARGDNYLSYGPWVYTRRSCVLGWYERVPDWLRAPADDGARRAALRALVEGVVAAAPNLAAVRAVAAQLPASCGVVHRAERTSTVEAIEIAFEPPIPAKVLVEAVHWRGPTAKLSPGGWTLQDVGERFDPESTKPLKIGAWNVVPRLEDHPMGPSTSDHRAVQPLDVVVSMRIEPVRANPHSIAAAAAAARSAAIMSAPRADYCQRILDSLAMWEAQDRAMTAAIVKDLPPPTLSLASYTPGARQIVARAQSYADERKHTMMTAIHVFLRLLALPPIKERVHKAGGDPDVALAAAQAWLKERPTCDRPSYLSAEALAMLKRAEKVANDQPVSLDHLVTACLAPPRRAATVEELDKHGAIDTDEEEARQQIIAVGRLHLLTERTN